MIYIAFLPGGWNSDIKGNAITSEQINGSSTFDGKFEEAYQLESLANVCRVLPEPGSAEHTIKACGHFIELLHFQNSIKGTVTTKAANLYKRRTKCPL
jgi:hypothetical protein